MSRSWKHTPITKGDGNKKSEKRQASRKVRRADVQNGGQYRKVYDSWNISDYRFIAWPRGRYDLRSLHKAVGK